MSIPLLIGLLVVDGVVGAAAGWTVETPSRFISGVAGMVGTLTSLVLLRTFFPTLHTLVDKVGPGALGAVIVSLGLNLLFLRRRSAS